MIHAAKDNLCDVSVTSTVNT